MFPDEPDDLLFDGLDDEHAAAIGRAIAALALLEHNIDQLTWRLAGVEAEEGACLTAQFSTVAARLEALIALAHLKNISAKEIKSLKRFMGHVVAAAHERNRLAHDCWFYGLETRQHYRLTKTAKGKLDFMYKPMSVADIGKIHDEITALTKEFGDFKHRILSEFYAWINTPTSASDQSNPEGA